ncbi:hypothetical protein ABZT06_49130, partial [Streptomyces sp. NPDC005483]|uniref:hypothetical protein n=1 Tax=Streptomyces sp. NPDC005483 TaxID=3154882 RepID=UPI0033ACB620
DAHTLRPAAAPVPPRREHHTRHRLTTPTRTRTRAETVLHSTGRARAHRRRDREPAAPVDQMRTPCGPQQLLSRRAANTTPATD